jgi:hypothetical protein
MHFVSSRNQTARIGSCTIEFTEGEAIETARVVAGGVGTCAAALV